MTVLTFDEKLVASLEAKLRVRCHDQVEFVEDMFLARQRNLKFSEFHQQKPAVMDWTEDEIAACDCIKITCDISLHGPAYAGVISKTWDRYEEFVALLDEIQKVRAVLRKIKLELLLAAVSK